MVDEVLDLTAQDKEQPPSQGAMEHGPVSEDPPVEAAGAEWSPLEMGRDKTGGEHRVRGRTHHGGEHLGCKWPEKNTASKQSLDLDFTSKLIYFKLAEGKQVPWATRSQPNGTRSMPAAPMGKSSSSLAF
jgi:hypothetical protein